MSQPSVPIGKNARMHNVTLRTLVPAAGLALALAGCSSSSGSGSAATSTTAGSGGASSTTTAAGSSGGDLCATVPGDKVAAALGVTVTSAKPMSAGERFRSSNTLPSCIYKGATVNVAHAEFIPCTEYQGLKTDPVANRKPLSGVGDEAVARADASSAGTFIDSVSKKGDRCLYLLIIQGADEAKTKAVTQLFYA